MSVSQKGKRKSKEAVDAPRKQQKSGDPAKRTDRADTPMNNTMAETLPKVQVVDLSTSDDEVEQKDGTNLGIMTADGREEYYMSEFGKMVMPLKLFQLPQEATTYPKFKEEIIAAYLRYTLFTVDVWMNYDTAAERFYYDKRAEDCGRMRLPLKFTFLHVMQHEYTRVRFDLCTLFGPLARVKVRVAPTELDVGARLTSLNRTTVCRDTLVKDGVWAAMQNIRDEFEPSGRNGLNFDDLESLAKFFCLMPKPEDYTPMGWIRDARCWMNFERAVEPNLGHVQELKDVCGGYWG